MAHDTHFLRRLERARQSEIELALSLYRDPALVHALLSQSSTAEGAERVAIALSHDLAGPRVIVERSGRFVTCLGRDMASDLPTLTLEQVEAIGSRHGKVQECLDLAKVTVGGETEDERQRLLVRRLIHAGPWLAREDFLALSSLAPLLASFFLRDFLNNVEVLSESRGRALALEGCRHPGQTDFLQARSNLVHAQAALAMLAASPGPRLFAMLEERLPGARGDLISLPTFSWELLRERHLGLFLKAAWAGARLGKDYLPAYKQETGRADRHSFLDSFVGLLLMALRHTQLTAEVRKVLSRREPTLRALVDRILDAPETFQRPHFLIGAKKVLALSAHLPLGSRHAYTAEQDVPLPLALSVALMSDADPLQLGGTVEADLSISALPFVARAQPEELFPPRDFVDAVKQPFDPERALEIVRRMRPKPVTLTRAAQGPNEPCGCGSGRKFKRCCASAA